MDSLVSLSSPITYAYSSAAPVLAPDRGEVFFEASAGVLGFVAAGRYLEERLRQRASRALVRLTELTVKTARIAGSNGSVRDITIDSVKVGDIVEVRAEERIPVDGVVVEGHLCNLCALRYRFCRPLNMLLPVCLACCRCF